MPTYPGPFPAPTRKEFELSPSLQRAVLKENDALEDECRRFKAQRDQLLAAVREHHELVAALCGAVTNLQGIIYGPPEPTPPDLDRALSAVARIVALGADSRLYAITDQIEEGKDGG